MPKPASTRPAYKMLTCIYLCRTLLFFAPYADFSSINSIKETELVKSKAFIDNLLMKCSKESL